MLEFVLYLAAFICFALAALKWEPSPRISLVAAGLAFWVVVSVIASFPNV